MKPIFIITILLLLFDDKKNKKCLKSILDMDFDYFDEIVLTLSASDKKKFNESLEIINEIKKSKKHLF